MVGSNAFSVPKCMGWCRWCWAKGVLSCVCLMVRSPIWEIRGRQKIMSVDCDDPKETASPETPCLLIRQLSGCCILWWIPEDLGLLHLAITRDKRSFLIFSSIYWVYFIKEVISLCHSLDSIFQRPPKRKKITSRNLNSKVIWHASESKMALYMPWLTFSIPENVP